MKVLSGSGDEPSRGGRRRLASVGGDAGASASIGQANVAIVPSTASGPISTTRSTPSSASVATPPAKATASRA